MHYKNVTMYGSATQPLREPRGSSSGTAGQISNVRRAEQRSSGVPAVSTSAGKYNKVSLEPGLFPASTYVLVGPSRAEQQIHTCAEKKNNKQ